LATSERRAAQELDAQHADVVERGRDLAGRFDRLLLRGGADVGRRNLRDGEDAVAMQFCCTGKCTISPSAPRATITLSSRSSGSIFSSRHGSRLRATHARSSSSRVPTLTWPLPS
jgi:hypothetical protein